MEYKEFTAGPDDEGRRLDRILRRLMEGAGINIFAALRKNLIRVNGNKAKAESKLISGDRIQVAAFLLEQRDSDTKSLDQKPNSPLSTAPCPRVPGILFRNEHLLILNKPYGIPVQPSAGIKDSLSVLVESEYKTVRHSTESLSFRPGPLHRLDRYTTGVLVFSQSIQGARWFSEAIASHLVTKNYIAVCTGRLEGQESWEDPVLAEEQASGGFHKVRIAQGGLTAITKATPLSYGKWRGMDLTLASYLILTGRKHQIRVQSAHHGHPLVGDSAYGGPVFPGREYFLHAYSLNFPKDNPLGLPETVRAPLSFSIEQFGFNRIDF